MLLACDSAYFFPMKLRAKLGFGLALAASAMTATTAVPAQAAECVNGSLASLMNIACDTIQGFGFVLTGYSGFGVNDQFSFSSSGPSLF